MQAEGKRAGTSGFYRKILLDHVIRVWFPRSIDREHGGFLCDFDGSWRSAGANHKQLEFQARQTLTAAELLLVFPDDRALADAVATGFAFMRDRMWDKEHGGWHAITDRAGTPLHADLKHAHGMAYAIEACFAVHAATGDDDALQLARDGFAWVDAHVHDPVHGGYFGPMARDGTRLAAGATDRHLDLIGTPFGWKDMNVTSDFYEALAYAEALGAATDAMRARLDELREIVLRHYAKPQICPYFFYQPDWTPASLYWRPATAAQTACRLIEDPAGSRVSNIDAACRLFLYAFENGWSRSRGALLFGRTRDGPVSADEERQTQWWSQFEILKAAEYLHCLGLREIDLEATLRTIRSRIPGAFVDARHGGISSFPIDGLRFRDRLFRTGAWRRTMRKGDVWKDASHDGRVLLRLARLSPGNVGGLPRLAT
jgi:mannose/cellobiose epimerase-like protein (N-acyl-D-glucosamine 2-epimerase family)